MRQYDVSLRYKIRIMGAAAYDLCAVARSAAIVGFQARTKIWDLAAGWLVLEEAGGCAEIHNGPNLFPAQAGLDYSYVNFPTVMAADPTLLAEARASIKKKK